MNVKVGDDRPPTHDVFAAIAQKKLPNGTAVLPNGSRLGTAIALDPFDILDKGCNGEIGPVGRR